jgi:hypothetical protein
MLHHNSTLEATSAKMPHRKNNALVSKQNATQKTAKHQQR